MRLNNPLSSHTRGPLHGVFMQRPEFIGSTTIDTEDGPIQINNFNPGNWYELDNPEFM